MPEHGWKIDFSVDKWISSFAGLSDRVFLTDFKYVFTFAVQPQKPIWILVQSCKKLAKLCRTIQGAPEFLCNLKPE